MPEEFTLCATPYCGIIVGNAKIVGALYCSCCKAMRDGAQPRHRDRLRLAEKLNITAADLMAAETNPHYFDR